MMAGPINFTKMHGCGNDFVLLDAINNSYPEADLESLSRQMNDRRFGVGGDGMILVMKGTSAPFKMRMFNPDGSESEMCGNGIRCFARYVREQGITSEDVIQVETGAGTLELTLENEQVRVHMGKARYLRSEIPMKGAGDEPAVAFTIQAAGREFVGTAVNMGNPHCVIFVDDVSSVPLNDWGRAVETNELFPNKVNVHFAQAVNPTHLVQRTWERGAGVTLACGTGACAVLVAAVLEGKAERNARIDLPGGTLQIRYDENQSVWMTGPAVSVFEGQYSVQ